MKKRVFLIVVDGLGIGDAIDNLYPEDKGSNTLLHILHETNAHLPTLTKLGLLSMPTITNTPTPTISSYGIVNELSKGKDSTVGHWEIAGHITARPFKTYPQGFPKEIIDIVCKTFGVEQVLLNKPYSGTVAIAHYGDRHIATGFPIVYTSADSCLQIACHSTVYSKDELHYACEVIRTKIPREYSIARIIARPFAGIKGGYYRTKDRKDFSISPPKNILLNSLVAAEKEVISVGKIFELFNGEGITSSYAAKSNSQAFNVLKLLQSKAFDGLVFCNLSDSDVLYGHRNDVVGYKDCLVELDEFLADFIEVLGKDDILIITADHGNDPFTASTDHSREQLPLIIYGKKIKQNNYLGEINGLNNISYFIKANFGLESNNELFNKCIKEK